MGMPLGSAAFRLLRPLSVLVMMLLGRLVPKGKKSSSLLKKAGPARQQQLIHFTTILINLVMPFVGDVDKSGEWIHVIKDLDAVIGLPIYRFLVHPEAGLPSSTQMILLICI